MSWPDAVSPCRQNPIRIDGILEGLEELHQRVIVEAGGHVHDLGLKECGRPVFLPAMNQAGISPILFGVVMVSGLAVGACTPPVGNCLNVLRK